MYWVYKNNSRGLPYQGAVGDWAEFYADNRTERWGSTEWTPGIRLAQPGDTILAYQTDRKELVGLATVVRWKPRGRFLDLILRPGPQIGVKVRPLRLVDPRVAAIPAFKSGRIATLYQISREDARYLLRAVGVRHVSGGEGRRRDEYRGAAGAGLGSTEQNQRVEAAAIAVVRRRYKAEGWSVKDVSDAGLHYDLYCTRARTELHLEVKGASGEQARFPITASEHDRWGRDRAFVLCLVTRALTAPHLHLFHGPGSRIKFQFDTLSYMARLQTSATSKRPRR